MGGAVSWPALSESTRPVMRSPSDSYVPCSGGSPPSSSQAPLITNPPQRQLNTNAAANNATTRPRSRNRGGGGGRGNSSGIGPSHNMFNQSYPSMPPPFPIYEVPQGMFPSMLENPMTGTRPIGGVGVSRPHADNDNSSQRNNPRRGNYGPRPRGDGPNHNNHGGRRSQGRRDVNHFPPQYMAPPIGYMQPPLPTGAPTFMTQPPLRPFPGQMGFDMTPFFYVPPMALESYRGMQIVPPQQQPPPPPPPVNFPSTNENSLTSSIVTQVNYYFSDNNLARDNFLRSKMDNHGWVPISLIASFPRMQQLTMHIPVILDALRTSDVVEVQGDRVRRQNDWQKWVQHTSAQTNADAHPQSQGAAVPENDVATSLGRITLDDSLTNVNGNTSTIHEGHTEAANGDGTTEASQSDSNI